MHLMQFLDENGERAVGLAEGDTLRVIVNAKSVYEVSALRDQSRPVGTARAP